MTKLASIPQIIDDAANGKIFILTDDEDRENEGDLIIMAQKITPQAINFMAKYGRGLICLPLTSKRVEELELPLMANTNKSRHQTPFTTSIEAASGISTGISAADRAHTILTAIDPKNNKNSIVTPGHIFPLKAQDGGVLVRAGHTEAAIDIAHLAGLNPSAVICEIMNEDGTMARLPDLIEFANKHQLNIATIADLIKYRRLNDKLITKISQHIINTEFGGEFKATIYQNKIDNSQHIALVKGDINQEKATLVRMHHLKFFDDIINDTHNNKNSDLRNSFIKINKNKSGVIVIIRDSINSNLSDILDKRNSNNKDQITLRNYGIGAQILNDLGIKNMTLLTNSPKSVIGLEGYDLNINGYQDL